jgi:hypothetical protein
MMFDGTGNMIVDKIIEKYKKNITKIGLIWCNAKQQTLYIQCLQTYTILSLNRVRMAM